MSLLINKEFAHNWASNYYGGDNFGVSEHREVFNVGATLTCRFGTYSETGNGWINGNGAIPLYVSGVIIRTSTALTGNLGVTGTGDNVRRAFGASLGVGLASLVGFNTLRCHPIGYCNSSAALSAFYYFIPAGANGATVQPYDVVDSGFFALAYQPDTTVKRISKVDDSIYLGVLTGVSASDSVVGFATNSFCSFTSSLYVLSNTWPLITDNGIFSIQETTSDLYCVFNFMSLRTFTSLQFLGYRISPFNVGQKNVSVNITQS